MVNNVFTKGDSNKSGQLDYTEYLITAMDKTILTSRDNLQKAFKSFDLVNF